MANQQSNSVNPLFFLFVVLIAGIFFVNQWLQAEIDQTIKTIPTTEIQSSVQAQKRQSIPARVSSSQRTPNQLEESSQQDASSKVSTRKRQPRVKVVYEVPMRETNLPQ